MSTVDNSEEWFRWRHAVADRIALLKRLRSVGPGVLAGLAVLTVAASLVPAATALAFAALVGGVAKGGPAGAVATTLLAYLAVLLLGHVLGVVREPLWFLAEMRIDGDHRAQVARLAAMSATIGAMERADVQVLIREARADPESFRDGTPGPGALAQLDVVGRAIVIVGSGAVLAAYAWWLVPVLALAAAATRCGALVVACSPASGGSFRSCSDRSRSPTLR